MTKQKSKAIMFVPVLVVAIIAGVVVWLLKEKREGSNEIEEPPVAIEKIQLEDIPPEPTPPSRLEPQSKAEKKETPIKTKKQLRYPMRISPDSRKELLANLQRRLAESKKNAAGGGKNHKREKENKEKYRKYVRDQIGEIIPLVKECYTNSLDQSPDLEGRVTVRFAVIADPEYGGLIQDSEIVGDTVGSESLNECVRETMYGLRLRPPESIGMAVISYPFTFKKELVKKAER